MISIDLPQIVLSLQHFESNAQKLFYNKLNIFQLRRLFHNFFPLAFGTIYIISGFSQDSPHVNQANPVSILWLAFELKVIRILHIPAVHFRTDFNVRHATASHLAASGRNWSYLSKSSTFSKNWRLKIVLNAPCKVCQTLRACKTIILLFL